MRSTLGTFGLATAILCCTSLLSAQQDQPAEKPALESFPLLRVDANGPVSNISALTFSPDGKTLYAAGGDKAIYVWMQGDDGTFQFLRKRSLRIPIGPGNNGIINAMAMSPDGRYLAVAGNAMGSHLSGFDSRGLVLKTASQSKEQWLDVGTIHVFDLKDPIDPIIIPLKGHTGPIGMLAFAPNPQNGPAVLVSAGEDYDEVTTDQRGAVRVWNLEQPESPLAEKLDGLVAPTEYKREDGTIIYTPRGITAIRPGKAPKTTKVAIAWGDHQFRYWDVANGETITIQNPATLACATVDNRLLLTGNFRNKWCVNLWDPPKDANAQPNKTEITFSNETTGPIGLLTSQAADKTALVLTMNNANGESQFFLINSETLARTSKDVVVGQNGHRPAYALSPDGRFVAVAGNFDRKIQIFRTADVKKPNQPKIAPFQVLEGQGEFLGRVRFYRKGDALGLGLNKKPFSKDTAQEPPDFLIDLSTGKTLTTAEEMKGWEATSSRATAKFSYKPADVPGRESIDVVGLPKADGSAPRIVLPEKQKFLKLSVSPETPNHPPLIGAIVGGEFAETQVNLYNAKTGEWLRMLQGHTDRVTALTFSADGKLLATIGADKTVRVWWLEDLNRLHVGKHGFLPGLKLLDKREGNVTRPIVDEIDDFASKDLKAALKVGDKIQGYFLKDNNREELVPAKKTYLFFYYLATIEPGTAVKLQVDRDGQILTPTVTLGQAVDDRKPLFNLFVTQEPQTKAWSWISWHPTGPFESTDRDIEELVGWHFNSGNADQPPRFADIGKYRKQQFGQGLLRRLVNTGKVPKTWPPITVKPQMSLHIHQKVNPNNPNDDEWALLELDSQSRAWATNNQIRAVVDVGDYPLTHINNVIWTLDGKPIPGKRNQLQPTSFEADLSNVQWKRKIGFGSYVLRATLETRDEENPEFPGLQEIVYHPGQQAPPVSIPGPGERPNKLPDVQITIPVSLTRLYAEQTPRQTPIEVLLTPFDAANTLAGKMTFQINGDTAERDGAPLVRTFGQQQVTIKDTLPLVNGENQIRVRLESNNGQDVTLSNVTFLYYMRPPLVSQIEAKAEPKFPRATITCDIVTPVDLPLEELTFLVNDTEMPVEPAQLTREKNPADPTQWKITATGLVLEEGTHTLQVVPRNADGRAISPPKTKVTLKAPVIAGPPPAPAPVVTFDNLRNDVTISTSKAINDGKYPVKFNVIAPGKLRRVFVYLNGERLESPEIPAPVDKQKYVFRMEVPMTDARNELRVLALDNNAKIGQTDVSVAAVEPPILIKLDLLVAEDQEYVPTVGDDLSVQFKKPVGSSSVTLKGRLITSDTSQTIERPYLKCWVNGFLYRAQAVQDRNKSTEWNFEVRVMLNQKTNRISLQLPEAGESRYSQARCTVECQQPNRKQRLHVVVVGFDPKNPARMDPAVLKERVEKAFQIRNGKHPNFNETYVYPLGRGARTGQIADQLTRINQALETASRRGEHDIVVFYYQGKEEVDQKDNVVLVTRDKSLTDKALTERMNEVYGAHVVILDVDSELKNTWDGGEFIGLMRSVHEAQALSNGHGFPLMSVLEKTLKETALLRELPDQLAAENVKSNVPGDLEDLVLGAKKP